MRKHTMGLLAMAAATTLTLSACSGAEVGGEPGDDASEGGGDTIRIGIKYDQPGLGLQEGEEFTGFDTDVARYVANELGYSEDQIEFVETISANRETALQNGDVDMIFATYSINDDRKELIDFAGPYFVAGQDLLVRMNESRIDGPKSLNASLRLCSTAGSTSAAYVRDQFANDVKMVEYAKFSDCVTALLAENVDAVTTDDVLLAGYAAQNPELLRVVGDPFSKEEYGVGLHRDDPSSKAKVQAALQKMIDSGAWRKSLEANIGSSGYKIPDPPKLAP